MKNLLASTEVGELVKRKRGILSVPDTGTVQDALQSMLKHNIVSVAVAASPGKWLGAGGTNVVDGDKQYIGIVSMLDVVLHLGESNSAWEASLQLPVTDLIGHSNEGMSLWVFGRMTPLLDAMEPLSKGVHRLLIHSPRDVGPVTVHSSQTAGAEVNLPPFFTSPPATTSFVSAYSFLSQTDVVRFLITHLDDLGPVVNRSIEDLGLVAVRPLAVGPSATVLQALKMMKVAQRVAAVAVVEKDDEDMEEDKEAWVTGGKLLGTLSASDFRGLDAATLWETLTMKVGDFLVKMSGVGVPRPPVTCSPESPLGLAMANAITCKVHRVWITTKEDELLGVVSLSDMIRACRLGADSAN